MKVLVTGAEGFIGRNLISWLERRTDVTVLPYDRETPAEMLEEYCGECDFVYNLAGANRPERTEEFMEGNFGFAAVLLETLKKYENRCPVMNASSIQAVLDNPYGRSKKAGEDRMLAYGEQTGAMVYIYRFPNVFGKWCRPNYNSAVATFCHNIAHGLPIQVNDSGTSLCLAYIDDVVEELLRALEGHPHIGGDGYCFVPVVHQVTLGEIVKLLYEFRESRKSLMVPDMTEGSFEKKLYSTYLSYLPEDGFSYPLNMHGDARGSFTEILRSADRGQMSVNISKPGIAKGNHWHHTKNEKFVVVSGSGVIRFRRHGEDEITEYSVSGDKLEVVDIPVGYIHEIVNTGTTDLVTLMWSNECYDPERPDTMTERVDRDIKGGNG
ncbi:MAG: capsular polysaccharide biosynthesis protein CapF [Butyrivibrio sp.]|nr:capsular polysaccharide biosynthesis protein CapF [Acetatifactor muris]MCM1559859.1 capsular polysaccharide biosynthesis protein CapF [Butyrivibrio sp.]